MTYKVIAWFGEGHEMAETEYFGSEKAAREYIEEIRQEGYSGELSLILDEWEGTYVDMCRVNGVTPGIDCPAFV